MINEVRSRPILFSAPMVKALLSGAKTVTRRIINADKLRARLPAEVRGDWPFNNYVARAGTYRARINDAGAVTVNTAGKGFDLGVKPGEFHFVCPYADGDTHLGDYGGDRKRWTLASRGRLWVRETHAFGPVVDEPDDWHDNPDDWDVFYRADGDERPWKTSHDEDAEEIPPPWRPSIFMPRWASRITLDVVSVRVERLHEITEEDARREGVAPFLSTPTYKTSSREPVRDYRRVFERIWCEINGDESWQDNPWVWRVEFKRSAAAATERAA